MNILFVIPYVPSRIRVRPFHIIKELSKRHSVTVIALGEVDGLETTAAEELRSFVHALRIIPHSKLRGYSQSLMALPTSTPMCAAFCRSTLMSNEVASQLSLNDFDLIHIEHLRGAHFIPKNLGVPVVFDSVDCLAGLFRQMAKRKKNPIGKLVMLEESWKLKRYEPKMMQKFDKIVITSDSERDEVLLLDASLPVEVIPNGVDVEYFAPSSVQKHQGRIVFSGKMSYEPNAEAVIWFATNVFPVLKSRNPSVEFLVVGSNPPQQVKELADTQGISVTGYVDDIRPYLESSVVAVVPMQIAVGIQNKILEAMALELPVVATPIATRPFGPGFSGIIEAETADETAEEVLRLLNNPQAAADIGRKGREEVLRDFSWQRSVNELEKIYEELLAHHP
jgi:sugar transferase (PEP-CTERM/EpsH1 system associated)